MIGRPKRMTVIAPHPDDETLGAGGVMSRFADPEPASAHNASLVRGRIHADMVSTSHNAERLEKLVVPRLAALARAYPQLVRLSTILHASSLSIPALPCLWRLGRFCGRGSFEGVQTF